MSSDWENKNRNAYLEYTIQKRGIPFSTMKDVVQILCDADVPMKTINLSTLRTDVQNEFFESLGGMRLRKCPTCGSYSIAPYIFCQHCRKNGVAVRLIKSCQSPTCLGNNMIYIAMKDGIDALSKRSKKRLHNQMKKNKGTEKLLRDRLENHLGDTCTHSRSTSTGEEHLVESFLCVIGDLIKDNAMDLLTNTTPEESFQQLDYMIQEGWASSALCYNRCLAYARLGMFEHARHIAQYFDSLDVSNPSYLHKSIEEFMKDNSPEKITGLYSNSKHC